MKIYTQPGDTMTFGSQELIATKQRGCDGCHFHVPNRQNFCVDADCTHHNIIWLTPANYIIHRLTS